MSYGNDMIIADLDAMESFLVVANAIKSELQAQISEIDRRYQRITDWEDEVQRKTGDLLEKIEQRADLLSDEIERLNRNFGLLIDDLKVYNNPHTGKFGRL